MSNRATAVLTLFLVAVAIFAFAAIFVGAMYDTWIMAHCPPRNETATPFTYVGTTLAALVGGIVAVAFGQPPPKVFHLTTVDPRNVMITIYSIIYVVVGLAAVATWMYWPDCTALIIKNLATTFVGLAVPIVANYFH
jgi:hypothetical protein